MRKSYIFLFIPFGLLPAGLAPPQPPFPQQHHSFDPTPLTPHPTTTGIPSTTNGAGVGRLPGASADRNCAWER